MGAPRRNDARRTAASALMTGLLVASAVVLSACVSPAVNAEGYRGKVAHSEQRMETVVASARLTAELSLTGKLLHTVADGLVTRAEDEAESIASGLRSVQPPDDASVRLMKRSLPVLEGVADALTDLRLALRRRDETAMKAALSDLAERAAQLPSLAVG